MEHQFVRDAERLETVVKLAHAPLETRKKSPDSGVPEKGQRQPSPRKHFGTIARSSAYAFLSEQGTAAVLHWIELAKLKSDDPLLTKSQRNAQIGPMGPGYNFQDHQAVYRPKRRFSAQYTGWGCSYSTRVGGVHDAFRIGCDLSSIMVAGRWTSPDMPARYGRRILARNSAAAKVSEAFQHDQG